MGILETLTLALGASWASGLNLYATVAVLGLLEFFGVITLPESLHVLSSPWVLGVAVFMYGVEFFADKIPGVDSVWDAIQTFIRVPAGAFMAASATGGLDIGMTPEIQTGLALLLGGSIAAGAHLTKAGARAMINTSPEPASNWLASIFEDVLVFVGISLAVFKPIIFIGMFGIFVIFAIWLLPKIWRGIQRVFSRVKHPVETVKGGRDQAFSLRIGNTPTDT
jgi:hypothetical protein